MTAISPRDGSRPRARRLLSRLAAVLVVGTVAVLGASPASAEGAPDATNPEDPSVRLLLSTDSGAEVAPGGPLLSTITLDNGTEAELSAGFVAIELNPIPLANSTALDDWLDAGAVAGSFESVATEPTPVVTGGDSATVSVIVDATDLGDLAPGVYPMRARLSGASTVDAEGGTVQWNLSVTTVLVVTAPGERTVGVFVPITATPANGALLTDDELSVLTAEDGALSGQLDAVMGTSAILGVDPAIPTAIRMLGTGAPQSAIDWLESLERLPNDTFPLQFADADPATQAHAGQTALLGPPDLTPLLQGDDFPSVTPEPTSTPQPTEAADAEPALPDNTALARLFGEETGILWPRADVVAADLDAFDDYLGGEVITILPSTAVNGAWAAHSGVGARDLLVTDAAASARLSAAAELSDDAAIDRELAAAAGHLFFATQKQKSPTVLIGLDRSETRSPVGLRELLSTFASPTVSLPGLRATPPTSVTLAGEPNAARATALTAMLADEKRVTSFSSILDEPALLLAPGRIRILRTIAVGVDDDDFAAGVAAQAERVQTTLGSVSIQRPKPVQLFTSAAPLPVWVRNELPWTVNVSLHSSPSDPRLDIQPVTEVEALASSSTRVDVPIEARVASGDVRVNFRLYSPTGVPIGQPATADVTLRADWEGIGLGILGTLIILLFVFGLVRTVLRKRRAKENDE